MKILGVSLNEFHDKAGFQLVTNIPKDTVLTQEQFNLYSDLILPREELCDRILAIQFKEDYFLVVNPLLSQNKEYDKTYKRQKYIYSLSILVEKKDYLDRIKQPLYKQLVSKIAKFFNIIEQANHIIYNHTEFEQYIISLLQFFFLQVNTKGKCDLTYLCNHYTFINANYPPNIQKLTSMTYASVPVTNLTKNQIQKIQSQLGQKLLQYAYEGIFNFKKICRMHRDKKQADLRTFYLKAAEKGLVFILDMINLQNTYVLTEQIKAYMQDQPKHQNLNKIAKNIKLQSEQQVGNLQILCLYLQFNRVTPVSKIIENNKKLLKRINFTKLIRLGQIHGFLKRIHQKIAYSSLPSPLIMIQPLKKLLHEREITRVELTDKLLREQLDKMSQAVKGLLNQNITVDQIMVQLEVDYERLLKLLNSQNRFLVQINSNDSQ